MSKVVLRYNLTGLGVPSMYPLEEMPSPALPFDRTHSVGHELASRRTPAVVLSERRSVVSLWMRKYSSPYFGKSACQRDW